MKNMSSDIVEQFTRAMVDLSKSNQTSGPVTVPGTIVSIGGSAYQVLLDGSTVYTPAESTVAYASGDRVSVSLADHKATIVGNYTDQSVGGTAAYNAGYSGGGAAGTAAATIYLLGDGQLVIGTAATNAANSYITTGDGAGIISNAATTAGSSAGSTAGATAGASAGQSAANSYITSGAGATIIIDTASTAGSSAGATAGATAGASAGQTAANDYITTGAGVTIISNAATTAGSAAGQQYIQANLANIEHVIAGDITADSGFISTLTSNVINASDVYADMVKSSQIITDFLTADEADINTIIANHLTAEEIQAKSAWVETLEAAFATIVDLKASFADIGFANISQATIENLYSRYAEFDVTDIKTATIQKLFADSGYITEVESAQGVFTKRLTAVEINAADIVAGVLQAERILLKGEDGLYHYLNSGTISEWIEYAPDWVQPINNPYMTGDRVNHNGKAWVSTIDNNYNEPGDQSVTTGWEEDYPNELYSKFDKVRYDNQVWLSCTDNNFYKPGVINWVSDSNIPNWIQPDADHPAYSIGDMVRHDNKLWLSVSDDNTSEPLIGSTTTNNIDFFSSISSTYIYIEHDGVQYSGQNSSFSFNGGDILSVYAKGPTPNGMPSVGLIYVNNILVSTDSPSAATYNLTLTEGTNVEIHCGISINAGFGRAIVDITVSSAGIWESNNIEYSEDVTVAGLFINGLDGDTLIAKTVTADKISVTDLHAFGATIGGTEIDSHAMHSIGKDSLSSSVGGFYIGDDGQIAIGDGSNYIRYFKDNSNNWSLDVNFTNYAKFDDAQTTQSKYIRFNDYTTETGKSNTVAISIGDNQVSNKQILEVDNSTGIRYVKNGSVISYWDGDIFYSGNLEVEVTKKAQFGNFAFLPRTDGSLMLLKVT